MASTASHHLGGSPFNHSQSSSSEEEYDRLRNLARQEDSKAHSCFARSHQAYESGDGANAHSLSQLGKQHKATADQYNKQASDFIFRENNAPGRVAPDAIDLHGQFVTEAEAIVTQRIRTAKQEGQSHLHVIVGKGHHSPDHIQKIKPAVEEVCREMGLQYATEENEGRLYVNLQGGPAVMPPASAAYGHGQQHGGHQQHHSGNQQQHGGYQQYGQQGGTYAEHAGGYQPQPQPQQQYGGYPGQSQQQYGGYPGQSQQQYGGYPGQQQQFQPEQPQKQQDPITSCLSRCCVVM